MTMEIWCGFGILAFIMMILTTLLVILLRRSQKQDITIQNMRGLLKEHCTQLDDIRIRANENEERQFVMIRSINENREEWKIESYDIRKKFVDIEDELRIFKLLANKVDQLSNEHNDFHEFIANVRRDFDHQKEIIERDQQLISNLERTLKYVLGETLMHSEDYFEEPDENTDTLKYVLEAHFKAILSNVIDDINEGYKRAKYALLEAIKGSQEPDIATDGSDMFRESLVEMTKVREWFMQGDGYQEILTKLTTTWPEQNFTEQNLDNMLPSLKYLKKERLKENNDHK